MEHNAILKLPDIHHSHPDVPISLEKVGVVGVRVPVGATSVAGKRVALMPVFDVFVDLPAQQKGIHASRSYEAITKVLHKHVGKPLMLEDVCASISTDLLRRHETAARAETSARADAVFSRKTPKSSMPTYESFTFTARADAHREKDGAVRVRRFVGAEVTGLTACPCAQEMLKDTASMSLMKRFGLPRRKVRQLLEVVPVATHIQRGHGSISMEIPDGVEIDVTRLVDIIEASMSSATYGLLKRRDEASLVEDAARHPRFVEDCIRGMIAGVYKTFRDLPDHIMITFRQRNEESIHKHDIVAERSLTMSEIRSQMTRNVERRRLGRARRRWELERGSEGDVHVPR